MAPRRARAKSILEAKIPNALLCRLFHGIDCRRGCGKRDEVSKYDVNHDGDMGWDEDIGNGVDCYGPVQDEKVIGPSWLLCHDCHSWTKPLEWKHHWCVPRGGDSTLDITKKRWDSKLQCWVLVGNLDELPKDADGYSASSCEIKPKFQYSTPTYSVYKSRVPWEGLDFKKWRNTYLTLMRLHFEPNNYSYIKHISEADWDDRLKGVYRPEPKYHRHYYNECEG